MPSSRPIAPRRRWPQPVAGLLLALASAGASAGCSPITPPGASRSGGGNVVLPTGGSFPPVPNPPNCIDDPAAEVAMAGRLGLAKAPAPAGRSRPAWTATEAESASVALLALGLVALAATASRRAR